MCVVIFPVIRLIKLTYSLVIKKNIDKLERDDYIEMVKFER